MERLTTEDYELIGCHGCEEKGVCYARYWCSKKKKALIELKRYEDTGLTPEQIMELKERNTPKEAIYEGDGYSDEEMVYDTWICPNCGAKYEVDYDDYDFCPDCGQMILR